MLKRLITILLLATAISAGTPVTAGSISDAAVAQLRTKGYNKITVRRTLLGRIRIVADKDAIRREIVIHPLTGQILRDGLVSTTGNPIANEPEELDLDSDPNDGGGDDDGDSDGGDDDGGDDDGGDDDGGDDDGGDDDGGDDDGGGEDGGDGDGDDGGDGDGGGDGGGEDGGGEGEGESGDD